MKNDRLKEIWNKLLHFIRDKKTRKTARISYLVTWNLFLLFLVIGIVGFSFVGGVGAGYFAALVKDEPVRSEQELKKDIYNYEETSEIYFADNVYLGKMKTDLEREEVSIDQISDYLKKAVIATEDEYFYEHDGVVPKAVLRAIYQEFANSAVQSGGSTLTQQLIKNQILTNEVSFERKAKEILLALRVEKFMDKEEILETYLNVSTFGRNSSGSNIAGVESAAEGLFDVEAKDLNLPQAAFIAGLPQSPFGYTPYTQKGELKENLSPGLNRMKVVLKRMRDNNAITQAEYEKAEKYDITKDFIGKKPSPSEKYPWVTSEIEKRAVDILAVILAEKDGYEESDLEKDDKLNKEYRTLADRNLRQNGYEIHSTINKKIYDAMQEVTRNYPNFGYDKYEEVYDSETKKTKTVKMPVEAGASLIENKTGRILSFVGGRDFKREQTNHATYAKRSNGSTMKPLLVYAPGIELGKLSPGSVVANVPVTIPNPGGAPWKPKNYGGGGYTGLTTAREALAKSYNIPAGLFYKNIINQDPVQYLEKMGFSSLTKGDHTHLSMALGGLDAGVTVEENVNAYTTFANSGEFKDAYMIEKIIGKDGKVVYEHKQDPVKVFSPQTAYLTLDMMRDVINSGTATSIKKRLNFSADWAGKTGTGQNYSDAWFVATNPNVTFGTWIGYDQPKSLQGSYNGLEYNQRNLYYWSDLMNAAYKADSELIDPKQRFEMPGGIVSRSFCAVSGLLPSDACKKAGLVRTDLFPASSVPSKGDKSFIDGQYVQVGNKRYKALPETPKEFTSGGLMLNPDSLDTIGLKYVDDPDSISILSKEKKGTGGAAATAVLKDNGKVPAAPSVSLKDGKLVWGLHPEGDVIGYRIYQNGKKVRSTKADTSMSFKISSGSYYVTAVDISGKESKPSADLKAASRPEKKEKEKPKTEPAAKEKEDSKKNEKETEPQKEQAKKTEQKEPEKKEPEKKETTEEKAPEPKKEEQQEKKPEEEPKKEQAPEKAEGE
ncbi:transglycosylase domain-containing protein [Bacillus massiliglaciei]|uniref:transglycosylase domain-containing protein n=1 Tax=Bacillus massiliglaciei TaxID=1816693 RepID=UPI000AF0C504|nr:transglycosylase domain-containing protein [Bacillus massiliglaciei]